MDVQVGYREVEDRRADDGASLPGLFGPDTRQLRTGNLEVTQVAIAAVADGDGMSLGSKLRQRPSAEEFGIIRMRGDRENVHKITFPRYVKPWLRKRVYYGSISGGISTARPVSAAWIAEKVSASVCKLSRPLVSGSRPLSIHARQ